MNILRKALKNLQPQSKDADVVAPQASPVAPSSEGIGHPPTNSEEPPRPGIADSFLRPSSPRPDLSDASIEGQKITLKDMLLKDEALAAHLDELTEKESRTNPDWVESLSRPLPGSSPGDSVRPDITRTLRSGPVDSLLRKTLEITEPVSAWRSLWLCALARYAGSAAPSSNPPENTDLVEMQTRALVSAIFETLNSLAGEFNKYTASAALRVTTTRPATVREMYSVAPGGDMRDSISYYRGRVSNASWSLSIRSRDGLIECFLLPVTEVMALSEAETATRLKLKIKLTSEDQGVWWTVDGLPIDSLDLRATLRRLFKDLIIRSAGEEQQGSFSLPLPSGIEHDRLSEAINELVLDKQNLVQKIVIQQEEIQNTIARDLHDAVISDVMMLKRSLSGDRKLSDEEVIEVLDKITRHLREICNDLAPRDLKDWGLQTVIDDMLQRIAERTGADCSLICDNDIPELPSAVQLHIYRIAQECLNNVEKYAEATRVVVSLDHVRDTLSLTIQDNGKGFCLDAAGQKRGKEGGKGLGGIRERADLIRCFYPTEVSVQSQPDKGSTTKLEIKLSGSFA